jgi:arginine exporter protein ArgO
MNEPKKENAGKKPPTRGETLFICGLCFAPAVFLILIGLGVVSGNVQAGTTGRILASAAGLVFFFAGVMVFMRDMAGVQNNEHIPVTAPLWIRAGESLVGIALIAAFASVSSLIALGPFFSADMFNDMRGQMGSFSAAIFRLINGAFALVLWYAAIYLVISKFKKRSGGTQ